MSRREPSPRVPCLVTGAFLAAAGPAGRKLADAHGLDQNAVGASMVMIEIDRRTRLLDDAATSMAEPELGTITARSPSHGGCFHLLERAVLDAPDIRQALIRLSALGHHVGPASSFSFAEQGKLAVFEHHSPHDPGFHIGSFLLNCIIRALHEVIGFEFPIRHAWLSCDSPTAAPRTIEALGTTDLRFGTRSRGFAFDADLLRHRRRADKYPSSQYEAPSAPALASRVRAILFDAGSKPLSEASAASALRMSVRSLRRRLSAENTSFRKVREELVLGRARWLLRSTAMPLNAIAHQVGYQQSASFSRAFSLATGVPPSRYRQATFTNS